MITLDRRAIRASKDGKPLSLTPMEFRLLAALAEDPGRVYTRNELKVSVLGFTPAAAALVETRTIDAHIYRLKAKLGADVIRCAVGFGYALEPEWIELKA